MEFFIFWGVREGARKENILVILCISSRYLKKRYGAESLPNLLLAVSQCINFLPTMATPFRMMMNQ